jgi:hypothetical protein
VKPTHFDEKVHYASERCLDDRCRSPKFNIQMNLLQTQKTKIGILNPQALNYKENSNYPRKFM